MVLQVIVGNEVRSGEDLEDRALRAASGLRALGIAPSQKVAMLLPNGYEFLEANRAIGAVGALAYPLSIHTKPADVAAIVARERFNGAIFDPRLEGTTALSAVMGPMVDARPDPHSAWSILVATASGPLPMDAPLTAPGAIFGTAGSTGIPKTVRRFPLDPEVEALRSSRFRKAWGMDSSMRTVVTGPMYHQAPLYWATGAMQCADLVVVQVHFDAAQLLKLIEQYRITHLHLVPRMFTRLLELSESERGSRDISSLRFVLHGTGPVSVRQKQAMVEWWGPIFREYYSCSEFGIVSLLDMPDFFERPTSVGRPFDGVQVEVRTADGSIVPTGTLGELYFASDDMPSFRYDCGDGLGQLALRGDFITVGDMGFVDEDGYIHLAGRREDKAVISGVNFFARPVEGGLTALDYVAEAAVIAVENDQQGDAFAAYIVLKPGRVVTAAQVTADLRPLLDYRCLPRSISFVESLPRFDSGKTYRRDLLAKGVRLEGSSHMTIDQPATIPLGPTFPAGVNEVALDEAGSTNAVALALAHKGAPHLTLVWTRRQTAGRGRDGRTWVSTDGNVFWSLLLRPQRDWPDVSELAYVAGLAVHAAVRPHLDLGKAVALKWPNDVLIDGAKVSGTLIEVRNLVRQPDSSLLTADAVVIGTGINVASHPVDGMMYRTTSLRGEGSAVDRDHLLGDLTSAFLGVLEIWLTHGFERIRSLWLDRAFGLGKRITVRISRRPEDQLSGIFESVDYSGCIQLRLDDGQLKAISAGDVFFRQAY